MLIKISRMRPSEIAQVSKVYLSSFHGMLGEKQVREWITAKYNAYPVVQYFVAKTSNRIVGYIEWIELGGFRKNAVLELEQIAVMPRFRGKAVGRKLITKSLKQIVHDIERRGSRLKLVRVSTGRSNKAQKFYSDVLGARIVANVPDLFRDDEVIMISRLRDVTRKIPSRTP